VASVFARFRFRPRPSVAGAAVAPAFPSPSLGPSNFLACTVWACPSTRSICQPTLCLCSFCCAHAHRLPGSARSLTPPHTDVRSYASFPAGLSGADKELQRCLARLRAKTDELEKYEVSLSVLSAVFFAQPCICFSSTWIACALRLSLSLLQFFSLPELNSCIVCSQKHPSFLHSPCLKYLCKSLVLTRFFFFTPPDTPSSCFRNLHRSSSRSLESIFSDDRIGLYTPLQLASPAKGSLKYTLLRTFSQQRLVPISAALST
jgi:hypothetical protein